MNAAASDIREKYSKAPSTPGVYLMKDSDGRIIYVGKAVNLKRRLSSYFVPKKHRDPKTAALLSMIKDFDVVITSSGHEAFILESNLIKEYAPKYNVILKDGKNYPLLRINMNQPYPAIERVRQIKNDHALYFGPYSSSSSMNRTLKQIQKIFRLRKCRDSQFKNRSRPCLNYQIKACLGLCCNAVSSEEYKKQVKDAVLFLRGRPGQVVKKLKKRMLAYSEALEFEKAARMRDSLAAVEKIMERQVVVSADRKDRDIISIAADKGRAVVTVMMVRTGFLIDTAHYPADLGFKEPEEVLGAFLVQYYRNSGFLPGSILLGCNIQNREALSEMFSEIKGQKVVIHVPMRGEKKRLAEMATVNAAESLEKMLEKEAARKASVTMLRDLLGMDRMPDRIECYDNSNLAGQDPVSSMVVFREGQPSKKDYRKFIIRDIDFQDDYAYMYQVLERRFQKSEAEMPHPDLLVVDGGKGQLGMAMAVLRDLGIEGRFTVAGLAKKNEAAGETEDKIYLPGRSNPLNTSQVPKALYLLQQVRDEAHRFAISFQRKRREKRAGVSVLDGIPGIGPKKKKVLLNHFKGISALKAASIEEIAQLKGMTPGLAQTVLKSLDKK